MREAENAFEHCAPNIAKIGSIIWIFDEYGGLVTYERSVLCSENQFSEWELRHHNK